MKHLIFPTLPHTHARTHAYMRTDHFPKNNFFDLGGLKTYISDKNLMSKILTEDNTFHCVTESGNGSNKRHRATHACIRKYFAAFKM